MAFSSDKVVAEINRRANAGSVPLNLKEHVYPLENTHEEKIHK